MRNIGVITILLFIFGCTTIQQLPEQKFRIEMKEKIIFNNDKSSNTVVSEEKKEHNSNINNNISVIIYDVDKKDIEKEKVSDVKKYTLEEFRERLKRFIFLIALIIKICFVLVEIKQIENTKQDLFKLIFFWLKKIEKIENTKLYQPLIEDKRTRNLIEKELKESEDYNEKAKPFLEKILELEKEQTNKKAFLMIILFILFVICVIIL